MSDLPKHAKVVIINAGIIENSTAYHLAKLFDMVTSVLQVVLVVKMQRKQRRLTIG